MKNGMAIKAKESTPENIIVISDTGGTPRYSVARNEGIAIAKTIGNPRIISAMSPRKRPMITIMTPFLLLQRKDGARKRA